MSCDKCSALLERLNKLRDRKDYYVRENKRLRAQVKNQRQKLNELERKHGNDV
ncbi:MAG: hypothetical protein VX673_05820 [Pseudomonadota bacterium]|nr:hypothetical protein [Pseudomonadota bacterium]